MGKSTLLNHFLEQKVAAVSPRPQTTRRRQLGILTLPEAQVVFVDTPGIHHPVHKLGEFMNEEAASVLKDMDCVLWLVDASQDPGEEDSLVAARLAPLKEPPVVFLVLNKVDLIPPQQQEARQVAYASLLPRAIPQWVSAVSGRGCKDLLDQVLKHLPEGEPFFDADQVTDLFERDIAADLVREAALLHLRDEVPHAIAVRVDEYKERSETQVYIGATIFVERDSHKAIVIGKGGEMLKKIGSTARREIEEMSGKKLYLELRVKVNKNWRNDPNSLGLFGYVHPAEES